MGIVSRLFHRTPKHPPLPPMQHPGLGVLTCDEDTTCWKGISPGPPQAVEIFVGTGKRDTYPDEAACDLVAETLRSLPSRDVAARNRFPPFQTQRCSDLSHLCSKADRRTGLRNSAG